MSKVIDPLGTYTVARDSIRTPAEISCEWQWQKYFRTVRNVSCIVKYIQVCVTVQCAETRVTWNGHKLQVVRFISLKFLTVYYYVVENIWKFQSRLVMIMIMSMIILVGFETNPKMYIEAAT